MAGIGPEVQGMIDQYVAQEMERVRSQGRAQAEEGRRLLDQQMAVLDRWAEWEERVERPARDLTIFFLRPGVWSRIPDSASKEHTEKIGEWVDRAESGDRVAQAVLLRATSILQEHKIPTEGLPSFEWQEPGKTEK